MKVERGPLLGIMRLLKPAVAEKSLVEGLTHVFFDGQTVTAFNDIIGIEIPCNLPIAGGLMGVTLLGILEHSSDPEADLEPSETEVLVKLRGVRAKLPVLPLDRAALPFGEVVSGGTPVDAAFLAALRHAMLSVAVSGPYGGGGITVMVEGQGLGFYSSDLKSISWVRIGLDDVSNYPDRIVLSAEFCTQLLSLCADGGEITVTQDSVTATDIATGIRLFGRLIEEAEGQQADFAGTIASLFPEGAKPTPLPSVGLGEALARAQVITPSGQVAKVHVLVDKAVLRLELETDLGKLDEVIPLEKPLPENKLESDMDAVLVARGLASSDRFLLNERSIVLLHKDYADGDAGFAAAAPAS